MLPKASVSIRSAVSSNNSGCSEIMSRQRWSRASCVGAIGASNGIKGVYHSNLRGGSSLRFPPSLSSGLGAHVHLPGQAVFQGEYPGWSFEPGSIQVLLFTKV
jgi:hypothetical protein